MSELDYWERRKAQNIYDKMDLADVAFDDINVAYTEAERILVSKANKVFDKFQRDYGLTEKDARAVLKSMKDDKSIKAMRQALEARPNDPNINQLLADLDSAAYSFRIKRFEALQSQVDNLRRTIYGSEKQVSDDFYPELMKDSYYRSTFEIQQQAGLYYPFATLPDEDINRMMTTKWYGKNYSERIWSNTDQLANTLKNEFLVSLMTGRSNKAVIDKIAERFGVARYKAQRLVRTESAYFHGQMEILSYQEADIEKYRFVAVLDLRTSSICRDHDGKIYLVSDIKVGVNYPPMHSFCRSTTISSFDEEWLKSVQRRARDPKTGKNILISGDMTYEDWYRKYVKPVYKVDGLDKWKLDRANSQYNRYKNLLGADRVPKSLEKFVDLKYNDKEGYEQLKQNVRDYKRWSKAEFPTEKSFNGHFKSHGPEFRNITKEQYQEKAANLLAQPIGNNILGYQTEDRRVRYDLDNNIYALGNSERGKIVTMFKPDEGRKYYDREVAKDLED